VASHDTLTSFLLAVYGESTAGYVHWAAGYGGEFVRSPDGGETYKFAGGFRPQHFAWFDLDARAKAIAEMLEASMRADIFVTPYLLYSDKRHKGGSVERVSLHTDYDGDADHEAEFNAKLAAVDGFAICSGTPHHYHAYVPLAENVAANNHLALTKALHGWLPAGVDTAKQSDNDYLRPPGTMNHKGRARGGESTAVRWHREPTGVRTQPAALAAHLGVTLAANLAGVPERDTSPKAAQWRQNQRTQPNGGHPVQSGRPRRLPARKGRRRGFIRRRPLGWRYDHRRSRRRRRSHAGARQVGR
jgi:putative DNA primase/helicase